MKKIPTLFLRESEQDRHVKNEVTPGCEWVLAGEGPPTAKFDGTACAIINGQLYKRYDNSKRKGDKRLMKQEPKDTWIWCEDETDRGRYIYWVPIEGKDKYHHEAYRIQKNNLEDGTYELCGPMINGNNHNLFHHTLLKHGCIKFYPDIVSSFEQIKTFLRFTQYEGIVWHHPDGRMAKITKKKFGFPW